MCGGTCGCECIVLIDIMVGTSTIDPSNIIQELVTGLSFTPDCIIRDCVVIRFVIDIDTMCACFISLCGDYIVADIVIIRVLQIHPDSIISCDDGVPDKCVVRVCIVEDNRRLHRVDGVVLDDIPYIRPWSGYGHPFCGVESAILYA